MDFWRAISILNNRKWLILLTVIVATGLTWISTRLIGAKWVGQVKLLALQNSPVGSGGNTKGDLEGGTQGSIRDQDRQMQALIDSTVKSKVVIEGALKKMGTVTFPQDILENIEVVQAGPRIFVLSYSAPSQANAASVANALAESFLEQYQKLRTTQADHSVTLVETQLKNATTKLNKLRSDYDKYRLKHKVKSNAASNVDSALARNKEARARFDDASQKIASLRAQIVAKELQVQAIKPTVVRPGVPINDPLIGALRLELANADKQISILKQRYSDGSTLVQRAVTQREAVDKQLKTALNNPLKTKPETVPNPARELASNQLQVMKLELAGEEALLPILQSAMNKADLEVSDLTGIDSTSVTMAKEIDQQAELRGTLTARLNYVSMAAQAAATQDQIVISDNVNNFNPPLSLSKGRTTKLILLAFLAALILSCAIVIALDSVDRRLRTVTQADMALPARVIAAIPQPMGQTTYSNLARATEQQPNSLHSEAYRFLGYHLLSPRGPKVKSIMVLSAKAEQGSTTTVTNLGITLAQAGKRVIVIDANIRTAELHQVFEVPNDFGFTDLLRDPSDANLQKAMRPTSVKNLSIITSGPTTTNAWELYRSSTLLELGRKLADRADFILYDTPSALLFTDALNLAPVVDAAFLCVRALEPLTGAEQRVVELLEQSNVMMLGSVLNDVPAQVVEGYHNYQHYYGPGAAQAIASKTAGGTNVPLIDMPRMDKENPGGGA